VTINSNPPPVSNFTLISEIRDLSDRIIHAIVTGDLKGWDTEVIYEMSKSLTQQLKSLVDE